MAVPNFQLFMLPTLNCVAKGETTSKDAIAPIAQAMSLSEDDLSELVSSGTKTKVADRISWSMVYMTKAGLLERPRRGLYRITDEGRSVLAASPDKIDIAFLDRYDSFKNFRFGHLIKESSTHNKRILDPAKADFNRAQFEFYKTPNERLEEAYSELEELLLSDLKEQLLKISSLAFEKLIIELMKALKYGARGLSQHTGQSGDGGIDGIITEDILGLDPIYL